MQTMFADMVGRLGAIDILVNNVGLQSDASFDQMTLAKWEKVIGVNLTGQFFAHVKPSASSKSRVSALGSPARPAK